VISGVSNPGLVAAISAAALLGFRHGVDYDHIAAIADLSGTARHPREAIGLSVVYGLGHCVIVVILGAAAIWFGTILPRSSHRILQGAVGCTLIVLGAFVLSAIFRSHVAKHPVTRAEVLRRTGRWLVGLITAKRPVEQPTDLSPTASSAFSIGVIHGIGAETPTQLGLFVIAAGVGGWIGGLLCAIAFATGLLLMSTLTAFASAGMFRLSTWREPIYRSVMALTGAYSIAVGVVLIAGSTGVAIRF
jgi:high-affinity nickel permease